MKNITIRPEQPADRAQVATLIARAFGADGAFVVELASRLRTHTQTGRPLAFVAETAGNASKTAPNAPHSPSLSGFVLFTPLQFSGPEHIAFMGPFAAPNLSDELMSAFVQAAYDLAQQHKLTHLALLGDAAELAPQGFVPAKLAVLSLSGQTGEADLPEGAQLLLKPLGNMKNPAAGSLSLPDFLL